jgi:hypothetical protein
LDPTNSSLNGPLTSIPVDWVQNSAAEKVNNVWFSQADGGYDNYTPFTIGATLVVVTPAPGTTFTDLTLPYSDSGPFTGYREIGLGYLTVDGTEKSTAFDYDK